PSAAPAAEARGATGSAGPHRRRRAACAPATAIPISVSASFASAIPEPGAGPVYNAGVRDTAKLVTSRETRRLQDPRETRPAGGDLHPPCPARFEDPAGQRVRDARLAPERHRARRAPHP